MFTKTLLPDTIRVIKLVSSLQIVKDSYLAGGTALALQIGHRISIDLDFFTRQEFDENVLSTELSQLPEFKKEGQAWRTVWGKLGKTKFSLFYYEYPLIAPTKKFEGIKIASKEDIAAMKIQAIADRGTKRDFIDLYFLSKDYTLDEMLKFYDQKYGNLEEKLYHLVRSLSYFADAEMDKIPKILKNVDWDKIKNFFQNESLRLSRSRFGVK